MRVSDFERPAACRFARARKEMAMERKIEVRSTRALYDCNSGAAQSKNFIFDDFSDAKAAILAGQKS
jgi:hypothetical protein